MTMSTPEIIVVTVPASPSSVQVQIPGITGNPGDDGDDGVSITDAEIDGSGHLILTFSAGPPLDLGKVTGEDGNDGVSITGASIDGSGHLILTFSSGGPSDLGKVTGNNGTNGVSITGATIDGSYHLILNLSSGGTIDAGYVRGPAGAGTGDVVGPAGTTTGFFARFADATGKLLEAVSATTLKAALTLVKGDVGLGNVDNTSDVNKPVSTAQQAALDLKAPLNSPAITGTPTVPTAAPGTNTTQIANMAAVQAEIAALIASAPGALNTLDELAAAMGDDANFAATMTTALAGKQPIDVNITSINSRAYSPGQMVYWTADEVTAVVSTTAFGRGLLNLADGAALRSAAAAFAAAGGAIGGQTYINYFTSTASSSPFYMRPSDYGTGKPQFSIFKHATANRYDLLLFDGVNNAGTINISAGSFTVNDVPVATTTGAEVLTNKTIERPYITNGYTEEVATYNAGATANVDLTAGSVHLVTLTAANWTPGAWPVATAGRGFVLYLKQDATGGRTVTFPSNVKWPGDTAPVLTATASRADKIAFQCVDGTNWHANVVGKNFAVA